MADVSGVTNKALPFSGVDGIDGELGSNASPNTSASNVPNNNNVSTTNANSNSSTTGRHTAKYRRMSTNNVSESPSRNGNNAFWHHSSKGGGAECSPQFVQPMLPEAVGTSDGRAHALAQLRLVESPQFISVAYRCLSRTLDPHAPIPRSGSKLGINCTLSGDDLGALAARFQEHNFHAFMMIGGVEVFNALLILGIGRK
ncbi:hypothetical protein BDR04DRAFT_1115248 [Suillus decipiens]|nr:hypothetical protein BDR04DRAFT_1115248 [Suillus decipiens]